MNDPAGPTGGSVRSNRGGNLSVDAGNTRAANSGWYSTGDRFSYLGFRLVRSR